MFQYSSPFLKLRNWSDLSIWGKSDAPQQLSDSSFVTFENSPPGQWFCLFKFMPGSRDSDDTREGWGLFQLCSPSWKEQPPWAYQTSAQTEGHGTITRNLAGRPSKHWELYSLLNLFAWTKIIAFSLIIWFLIHKVALKLH